MNLVSEARVNASNLMSPHMGAQVRAGAPGKSGPAAAREALVAMHGPVVALAFAHQPLDHALHERIVVGNAILDAGRDALERVARDLDRLLILPSQEDTRVRPASLQEAGGRAGAHTQTSPEGTWHEMEHSFEIAPSISSLNVCSVMVHSQPRCRKTVCGV